MSRTYKDIREEYREQRRLEISERTRARAGVLSAVECFEVGQRDGFQSRAGLPVRREWTIDVPVPAPVEPLEIPVWGPEREPSVPERERERQPAEVPA
jgi:hypothetical protein